MHKLLGRTLSVFILLLGLVGQLSSQQAPTRIEGKITDPVTHKPVGCPIHIIGPEGKKTKISSNSSDGTYLAVINEAGVHRFMMSGFNVYRAEFTVDVPQAKRFQEIKRDFEVRELIEGDLIQQFRAFERNTASFSQVATAELAKLKGTLNSNQQMTVVITVLPDEDQVAAAQFQQTEAYKSDSVAWAKEYKAWEKKYKKKKEKPEPPVAPVMPPAPADPNIALVEQRKAAVLAQMADVKNADLRVTVQGAPLPPSATAASVPASVPAPTKKSKKSKPAPQKTTAPQAVQTTHNTLVVKVGKVKRLFE